eukprot:TRINITY_DN1848_c0_g1_i1.p1 TRINITY_DN1848_c0_g1~~TRINITY_DN1848_c0_g1_i1.p1  ORF type:complete len:236 (-),score=67.13 TRINITY_DN1848_c0_g1_i1:160-801(-)
MGGGGSSKSFSQLPRIVHHLDEDTTNRLLRGSRKMSEYLHTLANEPSIGLYHVCDHISRNVPKTVETKKSLKATNKKVEDLNYDMDHTIRTVRNLNELDTFKNIKQLLNDSITTLEQIKQKIPAKPKTTGSPTTSFEDSLVVAPPQGGVPSQQVTVDEGVKDSSSSLTTTEDGDPSNTGDSLSSFTTGGSTSRKKKTTKAKKSQQTEFKPKAF